MEVGLEMRPFLRKLFNYIKLELGEGIRLESRSDCQRLRCGGGFWKYVLYLYKKYYMILNLVLGEGIRLESQNLLFRSLFLSVVCLEMRPIFVRKLLNNTKIGVG